MNGDVSPRGTRITTKLVPCLLFLSSYVPLFAILAVRFRTVWIEVACVGLATVGLVGVLGVLARHRTIGGQTWAASGTEDWGSEVAGYLATYLLPFVTVPQPDARDIAGYCIFLVVAGVIYVRSGLLQVNPTLYLLGWRVMRVTIGDVWVGYALTREELGPGEELLLQRISDRVFIGGRVGHDDGQGSGR